MTVAVGVVAVLVGAACWAGSGPAPSRRPLPQVASAPPPDHAALRRLRPALVLLAVLGVWVLLGGMVGLVAGAGAGVWSWRVLGATEGPELRRRNREIEDDLPLAIHLLGACLRAGSPVSAALDTVAAALPGAIAAEFRGLSARLALGADPITVWGTISDGNPLAPLGSAMVRAHRSGASVVAVIDRLSGDLRTMTRSRTEARARTVEVRAAAPLGVCLLPAFLLLGVVPMTVGLFSSLDFLG